ncbi:MAG: hypothetical protein AAFZ52_12280, partial [Bacteroidota bacterium]
MEDPVTALISDNKLSEAFKELRKQFAYWKKNGNRFSEENMKCQLLAGRYRAYRDRLTDGISDPVQVQREGTQVHQALIELNYRLPVSFWADRPDPVSDTPPQTGWQNQPPPPQTGGNYTPPNPQQQAQHDPTHIYGQWRLVQMAQHNNMMPVGYNEVATYNRNFSFQLFQNGMQTAWGQFGYQGIDLAVTYANGMVNRFKFTCFG